MFSKKKKEKKGKKKESAKERENRMTHLTGKNCRPLT